VSHGSAVAVVGSHFFVVGLQVSLASHPLVVQSIAVHSAP
jgi:hypothetical protein